MPLIFAFSGFSKEGKAEERKRVAAIVTVYRRNSHADVRIERILEGYYYEGEFRTPRIQLVSMYTDQVPDNDMSRPLAAKYGFKIYPSVCETLMMGGNDLAVDGVLFIGEHGYYHWNM